MAKKAKAALDPLKAKEQRQKKLLIALAPILVLVLVLMVPKTLKRLHASSAPPPAPLATTSTTPTSATPATGAPLGGLLAGVTTTVSGVLSGDAPATAAVGQLASLGRFASKDPFSGQIAPPGLTTTTRPSGQGGGNDGNGGTTSTPTPTVPTPPTPPSPLPTSAVIKVNGHEDPVNVGDDFPKATDTDPTIQPVFHLVSLGRLSAKISIAGGTLASGAPTLTIRVGKPVTLLNKSDGTRYTIELMPQGTTVPTVTGSTTTSAPAAAATTTASTTPATTTTRTVTRTTTTTTEGTTTSGP